MKGATWVAAQCRALAAWLQLRLTLKFAHRARTHNANERRSVLAGRQLQGRITELLQLGAQHSASYIPSLGQNEGVLNQDLRPAFRAVTNKSFKQGTGRLALVASSICLVLAGCAHATPPPIVIHEPGAPVQVPVRVACQPPSFLTTPIRLPDGLEFVSPLNNPAAASCLSPASETALQQLLWDLNSRNLAWRAWAEGCR